MRIFVASAISYVPPIDNSPLVDDRISTEILRDWLWSNQPRWSFEAFELYLGLP